MLVAPSIAWPLRPAVCRGLGADRYSLRPNRALLASLIGNSFRVALARPGQQDGATPAIDHPPRRLPNNQETAEGGDLDRLSHGFRIERGDRAMRAGAGVVEHEPGAHQAARPPPRTAARRQPGWTHRWRTARRGFRLPRMPTWRCYGQRARPLGRMRRALGQTTR